MNIKIKSSIITLMRHLGVWDAYLYLQEKVADWRIPVCKRRYARHLKRLQGKSRSEKIRVLFIVSEIAKWKEQRLYEAMERSGFIEAVVGLSAWNRQQEHNCSNDELVKVHERAEVFFDRLGDRHVRTVTVENGKRVFADLSTFHPDIVFYTEPWGPCKRQDPWTVSKYALTLYVPYFTPNYGFLEWDCHHIFHRLLYGFFSLNQRWCDVYEKSLNKKAHAVKFIPAGHPGLDFYADATPHEDSLKYVIYAPHCSIPDPHCENQLERYSTFDWNHKEILEYAKSHAYLNWVFKPHPLLKEMALNTGLMSEEELREYYDEWQKIGIVCEDGDYPKLFMQSRAMITDCGSFLTEYGATGKPIIHLICADNKFKPIFLMKDLYDTYYKVHDLDEMYSTFKVILEKGQDFNRESRIKEAVNAGIVNSNSSAAIVDFIKHISSRGGDNA